MFVYMQKTAYNKRISDWISDVCFPDLDVPPPLTPATGIDGPWLARLGSAAPAPPRRFPLPPSLAGVLGRPCSGRWHGHRRTGDRKGIATMTPVYRERWHHRAAAGMATLFVAMDAPLPTRLRVARRFTRAGHNGASDTS